MWQNLADEMSPVDFCFKEVMCRDFSMNVLKGRHLPDLVHPAGSSVWASRCLYFSSPQKCWTKSLFHSIACLRGFGLRSNFHLVFMCCVQQPFDCDDLNSRQHWRGSCFHCHDVSSVAALFFWTLHIWIFLQKCSSFARFTDNCQHSTGKLRDPQLRAPATSTSVQQWDLHFGWSHVVPNRVGVLK